MAIAPLQLPGAFQSPSIDLAGGLSQLGQVYQEAQAKRGLQEAFAGGQLNGDPQSLSALATKIMPLNPQLGMSLSQLGMTAAQRQADDAWRREEAARQAGQFQQTLALQKRAADRADDKTPTGFAKQPDGSYAPVPGGPQDPTYQARVAAETARVKGDLPTIMGPASSVIIPNRAAEGPLYTNKLTTDASLDDDTIKAMAVQARAGDTSVFQNLGRGQQGAENIVRLRKEMIRQNNEEGVTGSEQALRNAEMMGVKAGQRTIGTKGANIEMAATEFNQVLPVVQAASQAVPRTNYPDLNKIIMAGQAKSGDPNVVKFGGGVNTLINLYARAISPTGTPTVSDKDHAREILSAAWSGGQFDAAVGMMQQEIKAALVSPEKVRDEMRSRFLKGQGAAPVGYPAPGAPVSQGQGADTMLSHARDALAQGAPRAAVLQRLQQAGIDPSGL